MKILIITPRFPFPIEKGDKLRIYHQIRVLSKHHALHLVALSDVRVAQADRDHIGQYVKSLHVFRLHKPIILLTIFLRLFSGLPLQVLYFYNKRIQHKINELAGQLKPDVIYNQLIRTAEYTRNLGGYKVLDYMDAFSAGMHQRLGNSTIPFRWIYKMERDRLIRYEKEIYSDFNAHTIISSQDRDRIYLANNQSIQVIPKGVDPEFFQPDEKQKKYDICFVGNMGYRPNIMAAEYLCREILPLLNQLKPGLRILLAGARPHHRVKALANDQVKVSGWMEDIRKAYNESVIFVAPIFTGIGQQNKVLEAMSMQMPSICTSTVRNPIVGIYGEELLVADDAAAFAEKIVGLLGNAERRKKLGKASRQLVVRRYSWDSQVEKLKEIFEQKL